MSISFIMNKKINRFYDINILLFFIQVLKK